MYSIEQLWNEYNPEHDMGVDFTWVDASLLSLIERQDKIISELRKRIETIEGEINRLNGAQNDSTNRKESTH